MFGSHEQSKRELAAEIASVLAFSAIRNNDKVGLILFTDEVEKFIPPRKGRRHVLRVIREVLFFEPKRRGTDLNGALEFLHAGHAAPGDRRGDLRFHRVAGRRSGRPRGGAPQAAAADDAARIAGPGLVHHAAPGQPPP